MRLGNAGDADTELGPFAFFGGAGNSTYRTTVYEIVLGSHLDAYITSSPGEQGN